MNSALLSSKKMDYCTPQGFFDALNAEFHFTLDAAATEKSAKCKNFYTPETDGLTAPWNIGGGVARFAARRISAGRNAGAITAARLARSEYTATTRYHLCGRYRGGHTLTSYAG